jgi:glycolate oxidase FAD binding subunit
MQTYKPTQVAEVQALVRENPCLLAVGGRTKPSLVVERKGAVLIDFTALSGVLEYQPEEYTFTALAGTRLAEVEQMLADHGQYLPFDPPLVERGATLGGALAAGLSGSGRSRFGGLRDCILAIQFVDGRGRAVRSGGKVVKNAAGFDLSKFMVGSLGRFGLLTELTFKVFPQPPQYQTIRFTYPTLAEALEAMQRLAGLSLDLYALDLEPGKLEVSLLARLGGLEAAFPARLERLRGLARAPEGGDVVLSGEEERELWRIRRDFSWVPPDWILAKVPLTPARLAALDAQLEEFGALRSYVSAGNLAWVAWPGAVAGLDSILSEHELTGLVFSGLSGGGSGRAPLLGKSVGEAFARCIKAALDPEGKFGGDYAPQHPR